MAILKDPDHFIHEAVTAARNGLDRLVADGNDYFRKEPSKALVAAATGALVLRILPVTRIVRTLLQITLGVLKPAMLVYGGAKLWQGMHEENPPDRMSNGDGANRRGVAAGENER